MSKKKFKPIQTTLGKLEEAIKKDEGEKKEKRQVVITAKTAGQQSYIDAIKNNDIVFCSGPAGSGKTFIAVGMALQYLLASSQAKVVLTRPLLEAGGEHVGFLPGNIVEKASAFLAPVTDNLNGFTSKNQTETMLKDGRIEIVPIAFMRGRSFLKTYVICDEMQNTTPDQMLLVLSRISGIGDGEEGGSKLIISGDLGQSDIKGKNGLQDAFERLQGINRIAFVELTEGDIVRHPLIKLILQRYRKDSK